MKVTPDGLTYLRVTLYECIRTAYHVAGFQIHAAGASEQAVISERYDIRAKADHVVGNTELMSMLRTLLEDRFKLRLHREVKEISGLAMITGKKGLKLTSAGGGGENSLRLGPGGVTFKNTSMQDLAEFLSGLGSIQRPVLDRTSLTGNFDFFLALSDAQLDTNAAFNKRALFEWTSIFSDVQELGLKLEPTKAPVELLVIDHAEHPSEN